MIDNEHDCQLMLALQEGDDGALSRLMVRWQQPLTSFVFRYLQNHADVSEVVQETFVRVYQSRHRYKQTGRFSTWLFTIAANLCRNRARWRRRHPTVPLEVPVGKEAGAMEERETASEASAAPHLPVEERERAEAVKGAIAELPHELRTALLLFQYEHMSYQEIAAIAGCSPKAVETRLYRARGILKKKLAWLVREEAAQAAGVPPGAVKGQG